MTYATLDYTKTVWVIKDFSQNPINGYVSISITNPTQSAHKYKLINTSKTWKWGSYDNPVSEYDLGQIDPNKSAGRTINMYRELPKEDMVIEDLGIKVNVYDVNYTYDTKSYSIIVSRDSAKQKIDYESYSYKSGYLFGKTIIKYDSSYDIDGDSKCILFSSSNGHAHLFRLIIKYDLSKVEINDNYRYVVHYLVGNSGAIYKPFKLICGSLSYNIPYLSGKINSFAVDITSEVLKNKNNQNFTITLFIGDIIYSSYTVIDDAKIYAYDVSITQ